MRIFCIILLFLTTNLLWATSLIKADHCQRYAGIICDSCGQKSSFCRNIIQKTRSCGQKNKIKAKQDKNFCKAEACKTAYQKAKQMSKQVRRSMFCSELSSH